jgi:predicted transposase YbfD/YdcC
MPCIAKKTFEAARQTRSHLLVQLKKNQPELFERILAMTETEMPIDQILTQDLARNRREDRRTEVFDISATVAGAEWTTYLQCVIRVSRNTFIKNANTGLWQHRSETALHVSSFKLSAKQAAATIRGHWGIENRNHYVRDTAFVEDQSRIRSNPGIFARLRSYALNILRVNGVHNVKDALWKNAINLDRTLGLNGL